MSVFIEIFLSDEFRRPLLVQTRCHYGGTEGPYVLFVQRRTRLWLRKRADQGVATFVTWNRQQTAGNIAAHAIPQSLVVPRYHLRNNCCPRLSLAGASALWTSRGFSPNVDHLSAGAGKLEF